MHRDRKKHSQALPARQRRALGEDGVPSRWRGLGLYVALGKQEQSEGVGGSQKAVVRGRSGELPRLLEGSNMRIGHTLFLQLTPTSGA